jgi:F-type H+-transporting ATPase subunit alpha
VNEPGAGLAGGPLSQAADWVAGYRFALSISERGTLVSVGDGIVWVAGLPSAAVDDILLFEDGSNALVFDLNPDLIGGVLLHETERLTAGTSARLAREPLGVSVGDTVRGRAIDPLGTVLDGGEPLAVHPRRPLDRPSPPIIARDFVREPLYTGSKVIDTLLPIGKGQRQLIIGDEGLGRTSIALDAVIHQRGQDVYCVYVLIGQKRSEAVNLLETLRRFQALEYTTLVVAAADALPGLLHLAPFAGCAIAEYWMEQGRDVLIVYDDLSRHALNYRALSLLLRRPPGREAYPGDIFSVHARLLERSTCLNAAHGGGSTTALPIVETQQGEIAAYIPTNLISITDGQVYLDRTLFAAGFRPAIDVPRSVSRIGGAAQHPGISAECARVKLDYLRFLELEVFTRFGARLEPAMETALKRGRVLREILRQERLAPLPIRFQMAWLIAFNDGLFDHSEADDLPALLERLGRQLEAGGPLLDDPRERWTAAVSGWLSGEPAS